jgi:hypothetical protein
MIAVIGAMMVVAVLCTTILASSVSAMQTTSRSRASVQSVAAAEAGIDAAEAAVRSAAGCTGTGVYSSNVEPKYVATVGWWSGVGWVEGCPIPLLTYDKIRIISVGTARDSGVAGSSSGDSTTLEARYAYTRPSGSITASGGAVTAGGISGQTSLSVTNSSENVPGGKTADVVVSSGDFSCNYNGSGPKLTIQGKLIVKNGNVALDGCIVLGGIVASGAVSLNNNANQVTGGISAGGAVTVAAGNSIVGDIVTKSSAAIFGSVRGNVFAGGNADTKLGSTTAIDGNVTAKGAVNVDTGGLGTLLMSLTNLLKCGLTPGNGNPLSASLGCLLAKAGIVTGTTSQRVSNVQEPVAPSVPAFTGYTYSAAEWLTAGYREVVWPASKCTVNSSDSASMAQLNAVLASTMPTVVNAMACTTLSLSSSGAAALALAAKADVAFIAKGFALTNVKIDSAVSAHVNTRFIVPGTVPSVTVAACVNVLGLIKLNANVVVGPKARSMFYTPGCIDQSNSVIRGQEYAGFVKTGQTVSVEYIPLGIPGVNLDGGTVATATAASVGGRTVLRELPEG